MPQKKFLKKIENRGKTFEIYFRDGHWVIADVGDVEGGVLSWREDDRDVLRARRALVLRLIALGDRSKSRARRRGDAHQLGTIELDGNVFRLIQLDTRLLLQARAHDIMGDVTWVDFIESSRDTGYDAETLRLLFQT